MPATISRSTAACARLRVDQCVSSQPTFIGVRTAKRSICLRWRLEKSTRPTRTSGIVQGRWQSAQIVTLTHPPDRRRILLNFGGDLLHTLAVRAGQKNSGAQGHALWRVTIPQEALEFRDLLAFQLQRFGFAAAHGFAPSLADFQR